MIQFPQLCDLDLMIHQDFEKSIVLLLGNLHLFFLDHLIKEKIMHFDKDGVTIPSLSWGEESAA